MSGSRGRPLVPSLDNAPATPMSSRARKRIVRTEPCRAAYGVAMTSDLRGRDDPYGHADGREVVGPPSHGERLADAPVRRRIRRDVLELVERDPADERELPGTPVAEWHRPP